MPCVQPMLDYMAPEYVVGGRCDTAADMFSVGVLSYAVFNKGRTPMDNGNNLNAFKKNATQLKALPASLLRSVPESFRDDVKMCLNYTPDLRPDSTQLSKVNFPRDVCFNLMYTVLRVCHLTHKMNFSIQILFLNERSYHNAPIPKVYFFKRARDFAYNTSS